MSALAKIHVAAKHLRLDESDLRDVYERVTGLRSLRAMSDEQRQSVVRELQRLGFKPRSKGAGKAGKARPLSGPYAAKAQALWIALWNLGAVADRRDAALLAFFRRQTGIERTEWVLDAKDGRAVIEALKSWCEREGVDWEISRSMPEYMTRHGFQIALAQWEKPRPAEPRTMPAFWADVSMILRRPVVTEKPSDAEWIVVMNELGQRIRAAKAVA